MIKEIIHFSKYTTKIYMAKHFMFHNLQMCVRVGMRMQVCVSFSSPYSFFQTAHVYNTAAKISEKNGIHFKITSDKFFFNVSAKREDKGTRKFVIKLLIALPNVRKEDVKVNYPNSK